MIEGVIYNFNLWGVFFIEKLIFINIVIWCGGILINRIYYYSFFNFLWIRLKFNAKGKVKKFLEKYIIVIADINNNDDDNNDDKIIKIQIKNLINWMLFFICCGVWLWVLYWLIFKNS